LTADILDLLTDAMQYDNTRSLFHGDGAQFACLYTQNGPIGIRALRARRENRK
jgi:hypothetical protein